MGPLLQCKRLDTLYECYSLYISVMLQGKQRWSVRHYLICQASKQVFLLPSPKSLESEAEICRKTDIEQTKNKSYKMHAHT